MAEGPASVDWHGVARVTSSDNASTARTTSLLGGEESVTPWSGLGVEGPGEAVVDAGVTIGA